MACFQLGADAQTDPLMVSGAPYDTDAVTLRGSLEDATPSSVPYDFQTRDIPNYVRDDMPLWLSMDYEADPEWRTSPTGQAGWGPFDCPKNIFAIFNYTGKNEVWLFHPTRSSAGLPNFTGHSIWRNKEGVSGTSWREKVKQVLKEVFVDEGMTLRTNSLDSMPVARAYFKKYYNRDDATNTAVTYRFQQRRFKPLNTPLDREATPIELKKIRDDYFAQLSLLSNLSSMRDGDIITFVDMLRKYALYGISLYKNGVTEKQCTATPENLSTASIKILRCPFKPSSRRYTPYTETQWDFPMADYLGWSAGYALAYISAIENMFASDMVTRAVDSFFSMVEHSKQTDPQYLKALYANDINYLQGIDNLINARIPVNILTRDNKLVASLFTGIPECIIDPRNNQKYYPKRRLAEIYTGAMRAAEKRIDDLVGMTLARSQSPNAPALPGNSQTDISTPFVPQTADEAYFLRQANALRSTYLRYGSTSGLSISADDKRNLGLPEESGFGKLIIPAALAAAVGIYIATR